MYLPLEILSNICGSIPKSELRAIRHVSRLFSAAAIPFLFDTIVLAPRYASLEKARLVSLHFSQFVRTLEISSESWKALTWEKYEYEKFNSSQTSVKCRPCMGLHAKQSWKAYCKLKEEAETIKKDTEVFGKLCYALGSLPSVGKVVFVDPFSSLTRNSKRCWCQQACRDANIREPIYLGQPNACDQGGCDTSRHEGRCLTSESGLPGPDKHLWQDLLMAMHLTNNITVKEVMTGDQDLSASALVMAPQQIHCANRMLPNLTRLELSLYMNFWDDVFKFNKISPQRVVARTLSAAVNLEVLAINLTNYEWNNLDANGTTMFHAILGVCTFSKLASLSLMSFDCSENEVAKLIQASKRLRHMSLTCVQMVSGSWKELIQIFRERLELKSLTLDSISGGFEELIEAGYNPYEGYMFHRAIQDFLMNKGINPFTVAALEDAAKKSGKLKIDKTA
ncbi:hypothetical protein MMC28_003820 [Mycoblastus sanguinarius]|nr:hypothetical protein [Mycoblastus sanguinarius]